MLNLTIRSQEKFITSFDQYTDFPFDMLDFNFKFELCSFDFKKGEYE